MIPTTRTTVVIENVSPLLDGGLYPLKRLVGDDLTLSADIFRDGHDILTARLKWRKLGDANWFQTVMRPLVNDRWEGTCSFFENATYEVTIEAWTDLFQTWQHEFEKKFHGGLTELTSEILEGAAIVDAASKQARSPADKKILKRFSDRIRLGANDEVFRISENTELIALMTHYQDRSLSTELKPYVSVVVDRKRAGFAAWYEFFPRNAEGRADRGSTFRDCLPRIDDAKAMGFDVIYFPPIHPIGLSNRKGKNNSTTCEPGEPGVPYAIGNRHQGCPNGGGHKDVAPELGTLEDFDWLVGEIAKRGMEVALDFAINSSPDHPYVAEHPDWFFKRPDGTIKYAENPPKKYEDVYPLNFYCKDWKNLWQEMRDIILFWCGHGVKTFRVDNPHTKPVAFWEFVISEVRTQYPDTIFLSEAFTKPKMMKALAKAGFTQGYTYFTWRVSKAELTEYFTELTQTDMKECFRANLWPNTPDILPLHLQNAPRSMFKIRAILAATLSPIYGIYSGFELCENEPYPNKEEYNYSEKYQWKERDWNAPGNIKDLITSLNRIRHKNRAFQIYANLRFARIENEQLLAYSKRTLAGDNILLTIVNLDPNYSQSGFIELPLREWGIATNEPFLAEDLLSGDRFTWTGVRQFVKLDPDSKPAHILRIRRLA
ncbi:MAG: alpha-1,4-glucan--maltose-1-phosphate maltosyltransferase [Chthoniobacterales bacterium]